MSHLHFTYKLMHKCLFSRKFLCILKTRTYSYFHTDDNFDANLTPPIWTNPVALTYSSDSTNRIDTASGLPSKTFSLDKLRSCGLTTYVSEQAWSCSDFVDFFTHIPERHGEVAPSHFHPQSNCAHHK